MIDACHRCGKPLSSPRKLKSFCSYACRGQLKAVQATSGPSGLVGSKNVKQNKALQSLKRRSVGQFTFARINSCTIRVDAANKRGVGWLMEVAWPGGARQRWVAWVGNRASEPATLDAAKRTAASMLGERVKAAPRDWITELNMLAAAEVDRVQLDQERKQWPLDLMGGARRHGSMQIDADLRTAILDTELSHAAELESGPPLQGDDYQLDFDENGSPELPPCLDRRPKNIDLEDAA